MILALAPVFVRLSIRGDYIDEVGGFCGSLRWPWWARRLFHSWRCWNQLHIWTLWYRFDYFLRRWSSNSRAIAWQWTKMVPWRKYQRNWCGRPHSLERNDVVATQCAYYFPQIPAILTNLDAEHCLRATKGLQEIQWNNRMLDRTSPRFNPTNKAPEYSTSCFHAGCRAESP